MIGPDSKRNLSAIGNPFELILERLERIESLLSTPSANDGYTTRSPPPGMSRRRFNELCRTLHEHGDGRVQKFGRVWSAPRSAFSLPPVRESAPVADTPWTPEAALKAAGIRPQRL
jgi:hypothetical protein